MSLKVCLDKSNVVNSIRLQLRHPSGAGKIWVIVEGDTDQKLFSKLINGYNVVIEISFGGLNTLLASVSELIKETNRVIGIRDADFINLERKENHDENIFITDFHDAEMIVISCDNSYNSVCAEYFKKEKQPYLSRKKLLKSIAFIGGLRWINSSESLNLNFKDINLGKFYDGQTASLDEKKCLKEVLKRSPRNTRAVSLKYIRSKIKSTTDFLNLCNGHDFQKAFALCVNYSSKKGVKYVEIGKAFRVAYRLQDFQKTKLYNKLKNWSDNQSIKLFEN
jgi:hypothetical protein